MSAGTRKMNLDRPLRSRSEYDRRAEHGYAIFPIRTIYGWVRNDRRKAPERRIKGINVSESILLEEDFITLFKHFS